MTMVLNLWSGSALGQAWLVDCGGAVEIDGERFECSDLDPDHRLEPGARIRSVSGTAKVVSASEQVTLVATPAEGEKRNFYVPEPGPGRDLVTEIGRAVLDFFTTRTRSGRELGVGDGEGPPVLYLEAPADRIVARWSGTTLRVQGSHRGTMVVRARPAGGKDWTSIVTDYGEAMEASRARAVVEVESRPDSVVEVPLSKLRLGRAEAAEIQLWLANRPIDPKADRELLAAPVDTALTWPGKPISAAFSTELRRQRPRDRESRELALAEELQPLGPVEQLVAWEAAGFTVRAEAIAQTLFDGDPPASLVRKVRQIPSLVVR